MEEEFDRLYEQYHQALFQFLFYMVRNREEAEELVHDVYIKVMHSYNRFEGKSSEKTWLYSIARHVGIDYIRKQNRQKRKWFGLFELSEKDHDIRDQAPLPEEVVTQREEVQQLYRQLRNCTLDQQQVIILRYIQSLSITETAAVLGWTESKVKTTQHRALKSLKGYLEKEFSPQIKEV
ncbi:RNA polymerase sigma factor SigX [Anaerobacillus sp. MEB173]|uniref:RNA polymerase sigma factor SigX n=1 Tax=Anaerobacillus sp. MEB173 TaxID=3383345 RepID=UPI003F8E787E